MEMVANDLNPMPSRPVGVDAGLLAVPAGSANGTLLPDRPYDASTAIFYLAAADSIQFTIAEAQPGAPPSETVTVSGADFAKWPEELGLHTQIYILAITGAPTFRWY